MKSSSKHAQNNCSIHHNIIFFLIFEVLFRQINYLQDKQVQVFVKFE